MPEWMSIHHMMWTPRQQHLKSNSPTRTYLLPTKAKFPFAPQLLGDYQAPPAPLKLKKPPSPRQRFVMPAADLEAIAADFDKGC